MNIPVVEQVGFIALCSERMHTVRRCGLSPRVLEFIIGFGLVFTNFAALPRIARSWEQRETYTLGKYI